MMIGFNCDVVVGAAVEVVGAVAVGVEVVVVGGAVVAWSACGLGSATSLELLPHDAVSRLIARTHDPQSLRPAHLMPDSSPRPTKRRPETTERPEISGLSSIICLVELGESKHRNLSAGSASARGIRDVCLPGKSVSV